MSTGASLSSIRLFTWAAAVLSLVLVAGLYRVYQPAYSLTEPWQTAPLDAVHYDPINSIKSTPADSTTQVVEPALLNGENEAVGGKFRFVVGISNGHQGTSFLGSSKRYLSGRLSKEKVAFFFEGNSQCVRHPCKRGLFAFCDDKIRTHPLRRWYAAIEGTAADSVVAQEKLVEEVCLPAWVRRAAERVAVLGHDVIFYFQGLQKMLNETVFIRLRRPRIETARSFTLNCQYGTNDPMEQFEPVRAKTCWFQVPCKKKHQTNAFTLCPLERSEDVVLTPPSVEVWVNLTYFQRALWYVDELEARWNLFLEANPSAKFIELAWSSGKPEVHGSMKEVHKSVADVLGLLPSVESHAVKQHVKSKAKDPRMMSRFEKQDREYQSKMEYTAKQISLISKVQF